MAVSYVGMQVVERSGRNAHVTPTLHSEMETSVYFKGYQIVGSTSIQ